MGGSGVRRGALNPMTATGCIRGVAADEGRPSRAIVDGHRHSRCLGHNRGQVMCCRATAGTRRSSSGPLPSSLESIAVVNLSRSQSFNRFPRPNPKPFDRWLLMTSQPTARSGSQPVRETASQAASQPMTQLDSDRVSQPVTQPPSLASTITAHAFRPIERLVDLTDPSGNLFLNMTPEEAIERLASGDPARIREIDGQFAIVHKTGKVVRMARSIGRPLRYFIAKRHAGPALVVADRIESIMNYLRSEGLIDQFHPSYTRMVPAHYLLELALVGCPDPNPQYRRFFTPERNRWSTDLDEIGKRYITALATELHRWLNRIGPREPLGVLFSGGIDSGSVFLVLYHLLLQRGDSPARLKAFTLDLDGTGEDAQQATDFLKAVDLELFLERIEVPRTAVSVDDALRTLEDYKPLDVQSAAMALALCRGIRARYPDWTHLVDGDGGDENLKDYPIEDNPELTIRSVLNNLMLYQEGWGVQAIKHSLTYSGGQSRGHARTYAPAQVCGFRGFSPYALPNVIEVAEGIPFIELTGWDHARLYALKGEVVRRGVQAVTGMVMPVFEKRRFQHGAGDAGRCAELFPSHPAEYRRRFDRLFAS
jgi:asparagine synthase (glutamine-hydrolysing)